MTRRTFIDVIDDGHFDIPDCSGCIFYEVVDRLASGGSNGICCKHAPRPVLSDMRGKELEYTEYIDVTWPLVDSATVCGEWLEKCK